MIDDYAKARKKMLSVEDTSNLESDDANDRTRRKIRYVWISSFGHNVYNCTHQMNCKCIASDASEPPSLNSDMLSTIVHINGSVVTSGDYSLNYSVII